MIFLSFFSFVLLTFELVQSETFATQCFLPTYHRGISNAVPIAELWNVSPFDCLTHCIVNAAKSGDGCASVVYHRHFSTCQLYSHDGTFNGGKVVFANGHDYYNRTNYNGICQDRHIPTRGYPQRNRKPKAFGVLQRPADAKIHDDSSRFANSNSQKSYFLYPNKPTTGCSRHQKSAFLVLRDFALTPTVPIGIIKGVDRFACLNYCEQNIASYFSWIISQKFLGRPCAQTEDCQLHDDTAKEAAIFTRVEPKQYSVVVEKLCIEKKVRCPNEKHFKVLAGKELHHDFPLHRFTDFNTISECINACLEHPNCKAVSMKENVCHLSSLSIDNEPERLHDSPKSVVVDCKC
uniref:Apple domain-containing protein n=1 Tax=Panagrolaimus sp. JU765 TaxID=591449 RepID=A0AC34QH80_9BILA